MFPEPISETEPKPRRFLWGLSALVGVLVALAAIASCEREEKPKDPMLRAILADPMASFTPKGARVLSSHQYEGSSFLKPSPARVARLLALPDQRLADRAQQALVRRAEASAWEPERSPFADVVFGWKRLDDRWARLSIGDFDEAGEVRVSVWIEDCMCIPSRRAKE